MHAVELIERKRNGEELAPADLREFVAAYARDELPDYQAAALLMAVWFRGLSPAESVTELRQILALDPKLKVLVAHGLFDLATPYFGSKILLDQLPAFATPPRVKLVVFPGGHMFYARDASRKAFRAEAEALMK